MAFWAADEGKKSKLRAWGGGPFAILVGRDAQSDFIRSGWLLAAAAAADPRVRRGEGDVVGSTGPSLARSYFLSFCIGIGTCT